MKVRSEIRVFLREPSQMVESNNAFPEGSSECKGLSSSSRGRHTEQWIHGPFVMIAPSVTLASLVKPYKGLVCPYMENDCPYMGYRRCLHQGRIILYKQSVLRRAHVRDYFNFVPSWPDPDSMGLVWSPRNWRNIASLLEKVAFYENISGTDEVMVLLLSYDLRFGLRTLFGFLIIMFFQGGLFGFSVVIFVTVALWTFWHTPVYFYPFFRLWRFCMARRICDFEAFSQFREFQFGQNVLEV